MAAERNYYVGQRRRNGCIVPLLLVVLVVLLGGGGLYYFLRERPTVEGAVVDRYSGQPLADVTVTLNGVQARTNRDGRFRFAALQQPGALEVVAPDGYTGAQQDVPAGTVRDLTFALRPTTLSGTIKRKSSGAPLPGIRVQAVNAAGETSTEAVTGPDGSYQLANVPEGARLIVEGPGFSRKEVGLEQQTALDLELRPDILSGVVRGKDGKPIKGATIAAGSATATTKPDGAYTLNGVPENGQAVVKASGYTQQAFPVGEAPTQDFVLSPLVVKALYLSIESLASDAKFNAMVAIADTTEVNAFVIDIKDSQGVVYFESKNALAREISAVQPGFDIRQRMQVLKAHSIYTIARIVVMEDPVLAKGRPDWAIHDTNTGGVWKTVNGVAWMNAMRPEVWKYNTDLAVETAQNGVDEIQYDYVRFPSDGDLDAIDVGTENTMATRTDAVFNGLKSTRDALAPLGVPLGADIFGIALLDPNDNGIGQLLEKVAAAVDYICPMIYPSHYSKGMMGFDIPNNHPYEVILQSLQAGGGRVENAQLKFRPWLQDFSYGRGIDYGPAEVRAQMQATYDFGATGWMLWNADNEYTVAALAPQ